MSLSLVVANLSKQYEGQEILKNCSYSFDEVGIYGLIGPNGGGKSTFLRICALLEMPDRGAVTYGSAGRMLAPNLELRRRITLVLPKVGVFNTSVFKNVAFGLKIRGGTARLIKEKVSHALDYVGMAHKQDQNALTLSSGETQRLGLARALVVEPEVLFLDEPTASIDPQNTRLIEEIILKLKQEARALVIMATHDMEQVGRIADRVIRIDSGKISNSRDLYTAN
jgi:ABC-type multidrug transport system ATPase subunit